MQNLYVSTSDGGGGLEGMEGQGTGQGTGQRTIEKTELAKCFPSKEFSSD